MEGFRGLLNQIKFAWISLILNIKSFFSSNKHTSSNTSSSRQNASNGDDHNNNTRETSVENKIETKGNEIDSEDEQEEFYDALEELTEPETLSDLESDEEYFDAVEDLQNEQENSERKEYEENKYYNLQNSLQEKTKFDRSTATLALAFEISELPQLRDCNPDFSKFKLCELKQNGDKYTFTLEDNRKNRIELHSEYLNIYFPKYFEKHQKKGTYTKLFSEKENRISNDIIIPLQVPKEVSILTKEPNWLIKKVTGEIPDFPIDVHLKDCKDHVNFCLNSSDAISLSMTSMGTKSAARLSGTPVETNWPIKDILIRGGFINQHTDKQPEVEEISSDSEFEYIEVDQVNQTSQKK